MQTDIESQHPSLLEFELKHASDNVTKTLDKRASQHAIDFLGQTNTYIRGRAPPIYGLACSDQSSQISKGKKTQGLWRSKLTCVHESR